MPDVRLVRFTVERLRPESGVHYHCAYCGRSLEGGGYAVAWHYDWEEEDEWGYYCPACIMKVLKAGLEEMVVHG